MHIAYLCPSKLLFVWCNKAGILDAMSGVRWRHESNEPSHQMMMVLPSTLDTTSSSDDKSTSKHISRHIRFSRICSLNRPKQPVFTLFSRLCGCLGTAIIVTYIIPRIEKPFAGYPYLKAKLFNPLRYLHATYFDEEPPIWGNIRTYYMTNETAFVVNLDRDEQRLGSFTSQNRPCMGAIQRYAAHQWSVDGEKLRRDVKGSKFRVNGKRNIPFSGSPRPRVSSGMRHAPCLIYCYGKRN